MTDISVQNIAIAFEQGTDVLRGVSFDVTAGEHIGVLGRNGAGKTTLFRIMTGQLRPDAGTVVVAPGKRMGVLSQIPVYPEGYTGEDVLKTAQARVTAMGLELRKLEARMAEAPDDAAAMKRYDTLSAQFQRLGGYELKRLRDTVAGGLGIPPAQREQPFAELSGGEKTRLNLARLILEDTDILLLDEPTNHLDMRASEWLEDYVSHFRGTVLTASHDRYFLDRTVTRIVEILDGQAEFYSGNYSFYVEEKRRRYEERMKQYEKEQAKIAQLRRAADDLHLWAFMGNDKLHKRAFSIEKRIDKMNTTERPAAEREMRARFGEEDFRGDEVAAAKGLSKRFGERTLFSDTEFLVTPGERVALIGDNGTGKSTLVRMILGLEPPDSGFVRVGPSVRTAYLPQIVEFREPGLTVLETMMYEGKCEQQEARDRLGAYLFSGDDVYTRVEKLSGGERSRLKLCILMKRDVSFLVLDEPTNHLDIASREWMENALADFGGTLLFVSHDRYFIGRFATRIWELRGGALHDYKCGFERWRVLRELEKSENVPEKREKPARPAPKEPAERRMSPGTRQRRLEKLEREIGSLEERLRQNGEAQTANATDYEKLMELDAEKTELSRELDEKYAEWEALSDDA